VEPTIGACRLTPPLARYRFGDSVEQAVQDQQRFLAQSHQLAQALPGRDEVLGRLLPGGPQCGQLHLDLLRRDASEVPVLLFAPAPSSGGDETLGGIQFATLWSYSQPTPLGLPAQ